jgi:hypothetical protein
VSRAPNGDAECCPAGAAWLHSFSLEAARALERVPYLS